MPDIKKIQKVALKYPLKRSNYNFGKAKGDEYDPSKTGGTEFEDYMPNFAHNSSIINLTELA